MSFFVSSLESLALSVLLPLLFLNHRPSNATAEGQFALWSPPSVPTADLFFSPCTFPLIYPFGRRGAQPKKEKEQLAHKRQHFRQPSRTGWVENDSLCHINRHIPFICDLHRALIVTHRDALRLASVHRKHAAVLSDEASSSPNFVVLIVRQLAQPTSPLYVTRNSSEFGCLFRLPCETMNAETVQKFVRSTKVFMRLYASVLFNRWSQHRRASLGAAGLPQNGKKTFCRHPPMVLAIGLITNPRRITSVTLHTDNQRLLPFLVNAQFECTNMLLQGNPLIDVLSDLTNRAGHAIRDFNLTKGQPRRHIVPEWAWRLTVVAIGLVLFALVAEWMVVRRARSRKMRAIELGGIKAAIKKSKTHIIF
uniref:Transmembrane protein n=1 Tax=Globodera pallida TaxID=36090 RepID=A0A183BKM6_GLOPA